MKLTSFPKSEANTAEFTVCLLAKGALTANQVQAARSPAAVP